MKILVTGIGGQLGHDVALELVKQGHEAVGTVRKRPGTLPACTAVCLDITDEARVKRLITESRPDAVIHCAAWTAVDAAEDRENREAVFRTNVLATRNIAEAAKSVGAKMLYISTDYVFGGDGTDPRQPDDKNFAPLNVYGRSKLEGELAVCGATENFFIVRTEWLFGGNGNNFVRTMLNAGKTQETVRVVNDQIGTPTYTADLARLLADIVMTEKYGYYHATNAETQPGEYISRYAFAREIFRQAGLRTAVVPVTTAEYGPGRAQRPLNSRLDKDKLAEAGFCPLPDWKDALARYLAGTGEKREWDKLK